MIKKLYCWEYVEVGGGNNSDCLNVRSMSPTGYCTTAGTMGKSIQVPVPGVQCLATNTVSISQYMYTVKVQIVVNMIRGGL